MQRCIHGFSLEGERRKKRNFSFYKINLSRCMIKFVSKTYYIRTVTRSKRNTDLLGVQKVIVIKEEDFQTH